MNDLDLPLRTLGRPAVPVEAEVVRELTEADIALLGASPKGVTAPAVRRLSQSHHRLARLLSTGLRPAEAAIITGYSASRISILQADPSFQELMAFYQEKKDEVFAETHEILAETHLDYLLLLRERIEQEPDAIPTALAADIQKQLADRAGFGPASKSTNVNITMNYAERVAAGRARVDRAREAAAQPPALSPPKVIDHAE